MMPLNLFYEEPESDRWIKGDRYPRRFLRKLLRPRSWVSGHQRVFYNLVAGLKRIGQSYRINDYRYAQLHPDEVACIIGKPFILEKQQWKNPILFGASIFSHPCEQPQNFSKYPIERILLPGAWMADMWSSYFPGRIHVWPVGIDTQFWSPNPDVEKDIDLLIYDKIRWNYAEHKDTLLEPIRACLDDLGYRHHSIRYGTYDWSEYQSLLSRSKAMIFCCEHETQGIAYQEALACDIPILAWDRGGHWQDPSFYPHRVQYGPVTSVPYWDERCGDTFFRNL